MKKTADRCFLAAFLLFLFAVPALILFHGAKGQTSYYENRTLASVPVIERESLLSGDYFSQWDTWLTDHVAGRDRLLKLNTWAEYRLYRRPVVNDIVTSADVLLPFQTYGRWDLEYLKDMAGQSGDSLLALDQLVESYGGTFCYLGIPLQNSYFSDHYPDYLENRQWHIQAMTEAFFGALEDRGIDYVDMAQVYETMGRPEDFYSASDHHFTYYGAFAAYQATMEHLGLPALTQDDLTFSTLPNPFLGSRNRELYGLWTGEEHLIVGEQKASVPFTRMDNGMEGPADLYDVPEDEGTQITYDVYMGGDKAETIIRTGRPDLPDLLIFGDSFTNPLETLFYTGFDETRSLDLRHYTEKGILAYIQEYQPDVVICVRDDTAYLSLEGNGAIQ